MTVIEHLTELRRRLIICIVAVGFFAIFGFIWYPHTLHLLQEPYCSAVKHGASCKFLVTDALEPFLLRLKVASWTGLFAAAPVVLYQLWRFITPGLNPNEKRYAIPFVSVSIVLFGLGGVIAYLTFPKALQFLLSVGGTELYAQLTPVRYIRLILLMILAFGVAFEFPVVLVFLELAGVLTSRKLLSWWRPAIVVIFIVAAVITPSQDPYSLFAMAIPMCLFYAGAIVVGKLLKK
jgi:sec-independent protein translocase protein TatC